MNYQDKAAVFLFAKLHRTINTIKNFRPAFDSNRLVSNVTRSTGGKMIMFNGAFKASNGWLVFPFAVTFSTGVTGNQVSGRNQLAIAAHTRQDDRVWALLSIIDYLVAADLLPEGSLSEHIERISSGGELNLLADSCARYGDFCTRAAKDLPYDLSLEVLAAA